MLCLVVWVWCFLIELVVLLYLVFDLFWVGCYLLFCCIFGFGVFLDCQYYLVDFVVIFLVEFFQEFLDWFGFGFQCWVGDGVDMFSIVIDFFWIVEEFQFLFGEYLVWNLVGYYYWFFFVFGMGQFGDYVVVGIGYQFVVEVILFDCFVGFDYYFGVSIDVYYVFVESVFLCLEVGDVVGVYVFGDDQVDVCVWVVDGKVDYFIFYFFVVGVVGVWQLG